MLRSVYLNPAIARGLWFPVMSIETSVINRLATATLSELTNKNGLETKASNPLIHIDFFLEARPGIEPG